MGRKKLDWHEVMEEFNKRNHAKYTHPEKLIRDLYTEYNNCGDIAYLLRIAYATIQRKLITMGYDPFVWSTEANISKKRKAYNLKYKTVYRNNRIFIESLYKKFKSSRKMGEELEVCYTTILNYLRHYGIKRLPPGGNNKKSKFRETVQRLALVKGMTDKKIAKIVGCSKGTAGVYMNEIGLTCGGKQKHV